MDSSGVEKHRLLGQLKLSSGIQLRHDSHDDACDSEELMKLSAVVYLHV